MRKVPAEVMDKFYGCGAPLPLGIDGLKVLYLSNSLACWCNHTYEFWQLTQLGPCSYHCTRAALQSKMKTALLVGGLFTLTAPVLLCEARGKQPSLSVQSLL